MTTKTKNKYYLRPTSFILLILILLSLSSFAFADTSNKVEELLYYNTDYNNKNLNDTYVGQTITFSDNITLSVFAVRMRNLEFGSALPVALNVRDNSTQELLKTSYSTMTFKFTDVIFDLENLNLSNGTYRFEIYAVDDYRVVSNALSSKDSFQNGYLSINGTKFGDSGYSDLYFMLKGKTTASSDILKSVSNVDLITGGDKTYKAIIGIILLIALFGVIGYNFKKDFLLLISGIGLSIIIYLMGFISFMLCASFIIFEGVLFGIFKKNE